MNDPMRKTSNQRDNFKRRPVVKASLGLVFGAILGLIIGNMVGSQSLGLIFGAGRGLLFGSALDYRRK
jgi:uncharacterized membrane protein